MCHGRLYQRRNPDEIALEQRPSNVPQNCGGAPAPEGLDPPLTQATASHPLGTSDSSTVPRYRLRVRMTACVSNAAESRNDHLLCQWRTMPLGDQKALPTIWPAQEKAQSPNWACCSWTRTTVRSALSKPRGVCLIHREQKLGNAAWAGPLFKCDVGSVDARELNFP